MAVLSNLVVNGSGRILNKLYVNILDVVGSATFDGISTGSLTVSGNTSFNGNVTIATNKTLHLLNTTNVEYNKDNNVALIIGPRTSTHLVIDTNEVMAKSSGTNYNALYLNRQGGEVHLSSGTTDIPQIIANNGTISGNIASFKQINSDNAAISNQLSSSMITTTNLNVSDTLRATRFDLQHISQSGGSLYISPTVKYPNSGTSVTVTKSGTTLTITITDSSITSANMAGAVWAEDSRVKCSGTINGIVTGTMDGTVTSISTSSHVLTISVSGENSGNVVAGTYSASQIKDLSVMMYQRRDGSNDFRVGLWLSCYDIVNNSAAFRIYGGTSANPNAMLGNLTNANLPQVNGTTPTGWGLYADNAYLQGTIVSTSGQIGGWTIGSHYLLSGTWGEENGLLISSQGSTGSKQVGGSGNINNWVFTADKHFGVTKTGVLYANDAHISGNIIANGGMIAGFHIVGDVENNTKSSAQGGYAYKNSLYRHATDATYDYEVGMRGSSDETANATTGPANLAFYITRVAKGAAWTGGQGGNRHDVFYINHRGDLYCENIVATGGSIGGCNIVSGSLQVDNAHITSVNASKINAGTISADRIGARSINASKLAISDINNYVTVTESDPNTAIIGNHMYGSGANAVISDGYIVKQTASAQCIVLCPYTANIFKDGDQLRYTITLKGATAGSGVVRINYLNADKAYSNGNYNNGPQLNITTSEQTFTGIIKIASNANNYTFDVSERAYFTLAIYDYHAEGSRTQFYLKNASIYKMNGGELIIDGTITGDKIQANTIKASKLVLSDPTNYVTVHELNPTSAISEYHPFTVGTGDSVVDITGTHKGYITKKDATSPYLALTSYTQNSFEEGDELYYAFTVKGSFSGAKCRLGIWFYGNGTNTTNPRSPHIGSVLSTTYTINTTEQSFAGTLKITKALADAGYYAIAINDNGETKDQIMVKNVIVRKKAGGNLIVDGAITANKISAGAITAEKLNADAITVSSRNLLMGTRSSKSYDVDSTTNTTNNFTVQAFYYTYNNLQLSSLGVKTGDKLTLAFDWETSNQNTYGTFKIEFYGYQDASNPNKFRATFGNSPLITTSASNKSGHVVVTGTVTSTMLTATNVRIRFDACIFTFKVSRMSLTLSNREVDWSPSPYEVGGFQIDANSIHTINKDITLSEANSICLSSTNFARTVAGANRTNLRFAIGRYFGVSNDGVIYASNAELTGKITATSGKIGNFNITTSADYSASGHYFTSSLYTQTDAKNDATKCYEAGIQSGGDSTSVVFYVRQKPKADAWNASNSGQWNFYVRKDGYMYCRNANVEGNITAKTGSIGGFHITNSSNTGTSANGGHIYTNSLYRHSGDGTTYEYEFGMKGDATENPSSANTQGSNLAFYVRRIAKGAEWTGAENMFYVTHDGRMLCTNATITGKLTANSGSKIAGWDITSDKIYKSMDGYKVALFAPASPTTSNAAFYVATLEGTTEKTWPFIIKYDGSLISTKGKIANWTIDSTSIRTGEKTAISSGAVTLSSSDFTRTINDESRENLRFAIGGNFAVKNDGTLYCSKADISGKIKATEGEIGGCVIQDGVLNFTQLNIVNKINDYNNINLFTGTNVPLLLQVYDDNKFVLYSTFSAKQFSSMGINSSTTISLYFDWAITNVKHICSSTGQNPALIKFIQIDSTDAQQYTVCSGASLAQINYGSSVKSGHYSQTFTNVPTSANAIAIEFQANADTIINTFDFTISNCVIKIGQPSGYISNPYDTAGFLFDGYGLRNYEFSNNHVSSIGLTAYNTFRRYIRSGNTYENGECIGKYENLVGDLQFAIGDNFAVDKTGKLYCCNATILGETIAGFYAGAQFLKYSPMKTNILGACNDGDFIISTLPLSINNGTMQNIYLSIGSNFFVDNTGMLYSGNSSFGFGTNSFKFKKINNTDNALISGSRSTTSYKDNSNVGVSLFSTGQLGLCTKTNNIAEYTNISGGRINSCYYYDGGSSSNLTAFYYLQFDNCKFEIFKGSTRLFSVDTSGSENSKGQANCHYFTGDKFLANRVSTTNSGDYAFQVLLSGTTKFSVTYTGTLYYASDERKKNIESSLRNDSYKNLFMKISPFVFSWKTSDDNTLHFGISAQELQKSLNDLNMCNTGLVNNKDKDNLMVNYQELLMLSVPVVQEHETEIQKLKLEIESLKGEIKRLKGR